MSCECHDAVVFGHRCRKEDSGGSLVVDVTELTERIEDLRANLRTIGSETFLESESFLSSPSYQRWERRHHATASSA